MGLSVVSHPHPFTSSTYPLTSSADNPEIGLIQSVSAPAVFGQSDPKHRTEMTLSGCYPATARGADRDVKPLLHEVKRVIHSEVLSFLHVTLNRDP